MKRLQIIFCVVIAGVQILSCSPEAAQEGPVQMPIKENTWVRKEAVKKTQSYSFKEEKLAPLSVDDRLARKLKKVSPSNVSNEEDCLEQASELDKRRMLVQRQGGVWHAFEKAAEARKYSDYGMQIDSQLNRLVFSLNHVCRGAKGMPLDGWGRKKVEELEKYGKEKMRKIYIELGNPPADVDLWIAYAERGIESRKRNIPFSEIGESISRTENLVSLYEKIYHKEVNDASLSSFLSEAATLLSVIKDSLKSDPRVALAIEEENLLPIDDSGLGNEL